MQSKLHSEKSKDSVPHITDVNPNLNWKTRTLICVATKGKITYDWYLARTSVVYPMNWEARGFDCNYSAIGYSIDDAYNLIFKRFLETGAEWLVTIEDDVLVPSNLFMKIEEWMQSKLSPIVSGLYYVKAYPPVPIVFRGRGNGAFTKWKMGDKVWVDAVPFGCMLCHGSIIKELAKNTEYYRAPDGTLLQAIIKTPKNAWYDPVQNCYVNIGSTQDIYFCERILKEDVLKKAGWPKNARKRYPFVVDTNIFCRHIDINTGLQYP